MNGELTTDCRWMLL